LRRRPVRAGWVLAPVAAVCLVALTGCEGDDGRRTPVREPTLLALLTDGRLLRATPDAVRGSVRLAWAPLRPESSRLIAVTPGRRHLGVLLRRAGSRQSEVVVLGMRGLRPRARLRLPTRGTVNAVALVAPSPDRLVAVGDLRTRRGHRFPTGWVIDVRSGELLGRWTFPRRPRRRAPVIDAAPDGGRLYLSYHGGVDMISWADGRLLCGGRRSPCIRELHGEIAAVPGGVLGTGADDQTLLRASPDGRIVERWPTELEGNHLMRFAHDAGSGRAFALGSCFCTGGLARIDLERGRRWRRGAIRAPEPSFCGERSAARGRFVAVSPGPEVHRAESHLTVVDSRTGSERARLAIPAPAADVVLVP
jgi:hypothetical protein